MEWNTFFGQDNVPELQWQALSDPRSPARKALQRFIDLVETHAPVAALPRVRKSPDRVDWYVGWRNESDARFAADLLGAFLGRTYAEMSAPPRRLEPADDAERAFFEEFGERAFRIEVHTRFRKEARERLEALATCLLERPHRRASKVRPVGRILRDLELAMQAGDDAAVAEEIRALREGGHLDEVNLAFLNLRRFAAKRDWAAIFAHDALPSVLQLPSVPWRVRQLLVEAIYHRELAPWVGAADVDEAVGRFEKVLYSFGVAFSSRSSLGGLEVDVCFLLADEVRGQGSAATTESALARIAENGCAAFAEAFRARLARRAGGVGEPEVEASSGTVIAPPVPAIDHAQRALGEGDLDRAYSLALDAPSSPQQVKVLLQCARLLEDESASAQTLSAWWLLSQADRDALVENAWCKSHVERLQAAVGDPLAAPKPPSSWLGWFERLRSKASWTGAVSQAEKGVVEWDVGAIASDGDAIVTVVGVVEGTIEDWAGEALRQALPYVLEAFLRDPPDPRLAPVFASLFELLATDDALTLSSLSALVRLGQARLSTTPSAYAATLDVITGAIDSADTLATVPLVADTLEMLIMTTCASKGERTAAATRLGSVAAHRWLRIDEVDRDLIRQLCADLGVSEILPASPETPPPGGASNEWAALAGKDIAFYSLEADALQRVATTLRRACPNAKVKTFSELAGSEPMRLAARTADLFVIAAKSATHAATGVIMQHRPRGRSIEYARSKSSTSLLDAVRRWVHKQ